MSAQDEKTKKMSTEDEKYMARIINHGLKLLEGKSWSPNSPLVFELSQYEFDQGWHIMNDYDELPLSERTIKDIGTFVSNYIRGHCPHGRVPEAQLSWGWRDKQAMDLFLEVVFV